MEQRLEERREKVSGAIAVSQSPYASYPPLQEMAFRRTGNCAAGVPLPPHVCFI